MSKLTPLKSEEVTRKLRVLGFEGPYSGGRHQRMVNLITRKVIPVPFHKGRDVSVGLIREIIQEIGISREEWMKL
jgi:predicted RNA binding protein YcfA (HicA-like mRNA interferase family)